MSWDATLYRVEPAKTCANCGHPQGEPEKGEVGWWNYTHNVNGMIAAAFKAVSGEDTAECGGPLGPAIGAAWWDRLSGASADDGRAYLAAIIKGLESDPDRFRAMNPPNGWGDYDGLLGVLREMRDAAEAGVTYEWHISG